MTLKNRARKIYRNLRMIYIRRKMGLHAVDKTFYVSGKSSIASDLVAGPYAFIGPNCIIYSKVSIGKYSMLANNVSIIGGDHVYDHAGRPMIFSGRAETTPTIIGNDAWVGAFTIIMMGVTIGDGAIVAAGSIVTKDVEAYSIYGGVPAKKIRDRFKNSEEVERHKKMLTKNYKDLGFGFEMLCE